MLKFSYFSYLILSILAVQVLANPAPTTAAAAATKTNAVVSRTADQNKKEALAKKLIELSGTEKLIADNYKAAEDYLNRPAAGKTEKETAALRMAAANSKLELTTQKQKLLNESNQQLILELTKRFSEQELQYLIDINNYQTFKKYKSFLESDIYYGVSAKSIQAARDILANQKTKLLK